MTHFYKTLAEFCQTAGISMNAAFRHTTRYKDDPSGILHDIECEGKLPDGQTINELADYFGIGVDMFFKSKHESENANSIYLAGPITGHPDFMERFECTHAFLENEGFDVFDPAKTAASLPTTKMSRQNILDLGLCLLGMCNGIALIPGWQSSSGCRLERAYAEANRMRVIELSENDIEKGKALLKEAQNT